MKQVFKNTTFAFCGRLSISHADIRRWVEDRGAKTASSVKAGVTHLVCSDEAFEQTHDQVFEAKKSGIFIVKESILQDWKKKRSSFNLIHPKNKKYLHGGVYYFPEMQKSSEKVVVAKKNRKVKKAVKRQPKSSSVPVQARVPNPSSSQSTALVVYSPPSRGVPGVYDFPVSEPVRGLGESIASPTFVAFREGQVDVDPLSSLTDGHVWDCFHIEMLSQNYAQNIDKYYHMQLVKTNRPLSPPQFWVLSHWGRTGQTGQLKEDGPFDNGEEAKIAFQNKFEKKTGQVFDLLRGDAARDYPHNGLRYTRQPGRYWVIRFGAEAPLEPGEYDNTQDHKWQYYMNNVVDGKPVGWHDYAPDASAWVDNSYKQYLRVMANQADAARLKKRVVKSGYFTYEVDFTAMTQTNIAHFNRTVRPVRFVTTNTTTSGTTGDTTSDTTSGRSPAPARSYPWARQLPAMGSSPTAALQQRANSGIILRNRDSDSEDDC